MPDSIFLRLVSKRRLDGIEIECIEKCIVNQGAERGVLIPLSPPVLCSPTEVIFAPRRKYVSGELRGKFCGYSDELDSEPPDELPSRSTRRA
jgi:hypothetical protein